jgi:hypothetical protein
MLYPNGSIAVISHGPWAQLIAIKHCLCSDGRTRFARITGQPDTFFSVPASVKVQGKRVTGFVTMAPTYREGVKEGYIFQANQFGKNAALLPRNHTWED